MEMQLDLFSKIETKSISKNDGNKIKMLCDCKQLHPLLISETIHDLVKVTKGHYFVFLDDTWVGILKENAVLV